MHEFADANRVLSPDCTIQQEGTLSASPAVTGPQTSVLSASPGFALVDGQQMPSRAPSPKVPAILAPAPSDLVPFMAHLLRLRALPCVLHP